MASLINNITENVNQFVAEPIPNKETVLLIKEYWDSVGEGDKIIKAVWFSTADLIMILNEIVQRKGDGVRIYFGKYPAKDVKLPLETYAHMNTLVFVPTISGGGDSHTNIINIDHYVANPDEAKVVSGADAFNHGQLCPQKCN